MDGTVLLILKPPPINKNPGSKKFGKVKNNKNPEGENFGPRAKRAEKIALFAVLQGEIVKNGTFLNKIFENTKIACPFFFGKVANNKNPRKKIGRF